VLPATGDFSLTISATWSFSGSGTVGFNIGDSPNVSPLFGTFRLKPFFVLCAYSGLQAPDVGQQGYSISSFVYGEQTAQSQTAPTANQNAQSVVFSRVGSNWFAEMPGKIAKFNLDTTPTGNTLFFGLSGSTFDGAAGAEKIVSSFSASISIS
jgi:hypothetical protein